MKPVALRITNFRGFKKTQTFDFAGVPGLYFLQGINESEPRLGSNGAGKSTVWDALTWCLQGKTPRGLKAGDVCNWEAGKGCVVEFDCLIGRDSNPVTVRRTWGPIKWELIAGKTGIIHDLTKQDNNPVINDPWGLRLDFAAFLNTVLLAQQQPMFLDMKAGAQAELFAEVLGLERWLEYAQEAGKRASNEEASGRSLDRAVGALEAELASLVREDVESLHRVWEEGRTKRIDDLGMQYEQVIENDFTKEDLAKAEEVELNARAYLHKVRISAGDEKQWARVRADVSDCKIMADAEMREVRRLEDEAFALEQDEPCPTCGQRLPKSEWKAAVAAAARKVAQAVKKCRDIQAQHKAAEVTWEAGTKEWEAARIAEGEAADAVDAAVKAVTEARRARAQSEQWLDDVEAEAEARKNQANPFKAMRQRHIARLAELDDEIEATRKALDVSDARRSMYAYWVKGFKELRLSLIAEAIDELEVEVNSCVDALGLIGWELQFQVDRENKGGGISRGFSVYVKSPHSTAPVPWESWSGGEAQRLRVAAQMGLADLIRSRTGATIPLEVWDEPTAGLSPGGVDDLLEALRERAINEGREVWIVDHRTHAFGGFDGGATIIKTPSGSRVRNAV